jgi:hypothetical protein
MWSYALVLHLAGLTRCGINRLARVRQIPTAVMGILSLFSSSVAGLCSKLGQTNDYATKWPDVYSYRYTDFDGIIQASAYPKPPIGPARSAAF